MIGAEMDKQLRLIVLVTNALNTDGAHHKQWYLQQIARLLEIDASEYDKGIAP